MPELFEFFLVVPLPSILRRCMVSQFQLGREQVPGGHQPSELQKDIGSFVNAATSEVFLPQFVWVVLV